MRDVIVYHDSDCGTSRSTLDLMRNAGIAPLVIAYLKTPTSRTMHVALLQRMDMALRALLRQLGTPYAALGLDNPDLEGDTLLDAMMAHPILINRPVVTTPLGVRLCRPSKAVLDILPTRQHAPFIKEDGTPVAARP